MWTLAVRPQRPSSKLAAAKNTCSGLVRVAWKLSRSSSSRASFSATSRSNSCAKNNPLPFAPRTHRVVAFSLFSLPSFLVDGSDTSRNLRRTCAEYRQCRAFLGLDRDGFREKGAGERFTSDSGSDSCCCTAAGAQLRRRCCREHAAGNISVPSGTFSHTKKVV